MNKPVLNRESLLAYGLVTVFAALTYAVLIPRFGYYWDDWFFGWLWHSAGAHGMYENLSGERPATGILFTMSFSIFGNHILLWHIYSFLLRLAGGRTSQRC